MAELHNVPSRKEIEFLNAHEYCKFASINKDGSPHVTPTWFVYEETNNTFLITTPETTVKARNIKRDPRVALLVDDGSNDQYVTAKGKAKINYDRDGNRDTGLLAIKYMGEKAARKVLPSVLKVKHVTIEVIPEKIISYNI